MGGWGKRADTSWAKATFEIYSQRAYSWAMLTEATRRPKPPDGRVAASANSSDGVFEKNHQCNCETKCQLHLKQTATSSALTSPAAATQLADLWQNAGHQLDSTTMNRLINHKLLFS